MENSFYPRIYDQRENRINPNTAGIILIVVLLLLILYYVTDSGSQSKPSSVASTASKPAVASKPVSSGATQVVSVPKVTTTAPAQVPSVPVTSSPVTIAPKPVVTSPAPAQAITMTATSQSSATQQAPVQTPIKQLVPNVTIPYEYLGCYTYPGYLDITNLEKTGALKDYYKLRTDAIKKCYVEAKAKGLPYFGVMDGGRCMGLTEAQYKLKGVSTKCQADGEGGEWANAVYKVSPYDYLGCYNYPGWDNITSLEKVGALKDNYKLRTDAIKKCYVEAKAKNLPFFGVMDGGRCMGMTESQYKLKGTSDKCATDGEGGLLVNSVYKINN